MAQTSDSLAVETPLDSIQTQNIKIQEVKISENETFIYQKPKIWDIVNKTSQEQPQISFQKNTIHTDLPPWEAPLLSSLPTLGSLEKAEILAKLSA